MGGRLRPHVLSTSVTALIDSVASVTHQAPPDSDQVVEVGAAVAEAAVTLATLLTIVFFWLVEHAQLQRYLLSFVPATGAPGRAMRGTRSRRGWACGYAAS